MLGKLSFECFSTYNTILSFHSNFSSARFFFHLFFSLPNQCTHEICTVQSNWALWTWWHFFLLVSEKRKTSHSTFCVCLLGYQFLFNCLRHNMISHFFSAFVEYPSKLSDFISSFCTINVRFFFFLILYSPFFALKRNGDGIGDAARATQKEMFLFLLQKKKCSVYLMPSTKERYF